jgi:hypothetical protein
MARSYPIRTPRYPTCFHYNHDRLLSRIHSIQLPRNGLDMFRPLWNIEHAVCLLVYTWVEIATCELGTGCWIQCYLVLALSVSLHTVLRQELMRSASYLLILTYDKSAAAPDHITLTHFLGSLINPVPSISKFSRTQSSNTRETDWQSGQSWSQ